MFDENNLKVIYYDWTKGMTPINEHGKPTSIMVSIDDDTTITICNVKFFDTKQGFIQTEDHFYIPRALTGE